MPRGLPDYYNPDTLVSQRLANVEEVVTSLRGIGSIDNRGRTLFCENFGEGLFGWLNAYNPDAVIPVASTAYSLFSPASAFLDAGTSGGGGFSSIYKRFHLAATTRLGFEVYSLYSNVTPILRMDIHYDLEGDEFFARLEMLPSTGVVRIWVPGEWVTVGNVGYVGSGSLPWVPLKLVADFATGKYVRALIGQVEVDLSAYALDTFYTGAPGWAEYQIRCIATNAVTNKGYIGYAAGTVDEP